MNGHKSNAIFLKKEKERLIFRKKGIKKAIAVAMACF